MSRIYRKSSLVVMSWFVVSGLIGCLTVSTFARAGVVPTPPEIEARAYFLQDYDSGTVLVSHNADERLEPASLTKMMTAYAVFAELRGGNLALDDEVLISEKAWRMPGSRMFIEVGDRVDVEALLKGVIVQSGNDASVALAEHVAGDEAAFSGMMNQYAERLGMTGSNFVNSSGLPDPQHYTTAEDMARMANALIREFPEYYQWHAIKQFEYNGINQPNRNRLLWSDDSVDGLKTGYTESAGYCLVTSAARDDMRLVSVIMGSASEKTRTVDSTALLGYGFRGFETRRLYAGREAIAQRRVWQGDRETFNVGLARDLFVTVPRGDYKHLRAAMDVDSNVIAPVADGARIGVVRVRLGEQLLAERPLIALEEVPPGSLWRQLTDSVRLLFE